MKTIDYSCMSHFELDCKAAQKLFPNACIAINEELRIFLDEAPFDYEEFRPSYDDNLQADKYLFEALFFRSDEFSFTYHMEMGKHDVVIEDFHKEIEVCVEVTHSKEDQTAEINKAKVRAWLEAWDELDKWEEKNEDSHSE